MGQISFGRFNKELLKVVGEERWQLLRSAIDCIEGASLVKKQFGDRKNNPSNDGHANCYCWFCRFPRG
ncbi:hypothetical protein R84981_000958 [Carnimonas sp. R-84981]